MGIWSKELEEIRKKEIGGNQVVYSGTAYFAYNHFAKYFDKWRRIIASRGDEQKIRAVFDDSTQSLEGFDWKDYCILRIPYTCTPEGLLDSGIIAQSKASMTTSQFLMEYGACFPKDSDGFYKRSIIDAATTNRPIQVSNGDKIQFSAMRTGQKDRSYVMAIDPAADQDNAAIVILELGEGYRKVAHCWTTNRKRYNAYKKIMSDSDTPVGDDYYRYIAKKIRSLMSQFNIEHIIMDKNGGGTAIEEALSSRDTCAEGEHPVFTVIDPEEPKQTDMENGIHILQMLAPTMDINRDANHGMLKDLQDKALLFPLFDTVELAKSVELDNINNVRFDTYEDLVLEIEDLKTEITSIVCKPSSTLGKETFDTPDTKMPGQAKKGRMRKDRYSALLYANYFARNKDRNEPLKMHYVPVGGTKGMNKGQSGQRSTGSMYTGPGLLKFGRDKWISGGGGRVSRK
jgi:hypothetical protein